MMPSPAHSQRLQSVQGDLGGAIGIGAPQLEHSHISFLMSELTTLTITMAGIRSSSTTPTEIATPTSAKTMTASANQASSAAPTPVSHARQPVITIVRLFLVITITRLVVTVSSPFHRLNTGRVRV